MGERGGGAGGGGAERGGVKGRKRRRRRRRGGTRIGREQKNGDAVAGRRKRGRGCKIEKKKKMKEGEQGREVQKERTGLSLCFWLDAKAKGEYEWRGGVRASGMEKPS